MTPVVRADQLTVFVPVLLVNEKNLGQRQHWSARARRARQHREATALAILFALRQAGFTRAVNPQTPKAIHLCAHVFNEFDSIDGLRAACSHVVDGLKDAGLINDDADRHGHAFTYEQVIDRTQRGVMLTVRMRA